MTVKPLIVLGLGVLLLLLFPDPQLTDIMAHVGWERAHTARCYMKLEKGFMKRKYVRFPNDRGSDYQQMAELTQLYHDLNAVKDFVFAFLQLNSQKRKSLRV